MDAARLNFWRWFFKTFDIFGFKYAIISWIFWQSLFFWGGGGGGGARTVRALPRREFGQELCGKPPTRYAGSCNMAQGSEQTAIHSPLGIRPWSVLGAQENRKSGITCLWGSPFRPSSPLLGLTQQHPELLSVYPESVPPTCQTDHDIRSLTESSKICEWTLTDLSTGFSAWRSFCACVCRLHSTSNEPSPVLFMHLRVTALLNEPLLHDERRQPA